MTRKEERERKDGTEKEQRGNKYFLISPSSCLFFISTPVPLVSHDDTSQREFRPLSLSIGRSPTYFSRRTRFRFFSFDDAPFPLTPSTATFPVTTATFTLYYNACATKPIQKNEVERRKQPLEKK